MKIIPAKPYVKLSYHPKHNMDEAIKFFTQGKKFCLILTKDRLKLNYALFKSSNNTPEVGALLLWYVPQHQLILIII